VDSWAIIVMYSLYTNSMVTKRKLIIGVVAGFAIGALWVVGLRYATYKDTRVHHHANFTLYINGTKDDFKSTTFYEETQSCSADEIGPRARVHLHSQQPEVVHVHDNGVTWGHLFANLGYGLGPSSLETDEGVFVDGADGNKLTYILNGKEVNSMANEVIQSEDALLISYGKEDASVLQKRFEGINKNAAQFNVTADPSSCSGSKPLTPAEKFRKSVGIGTN